MECLHCEKNPVFSIKRFTFQFENQLLSLSDYYQASSGGIWLDFWIKNVVSDRWKINEIIQQMIYRQYNTIKIVVSPSKIVVSMSTTFFFFETVTANLLISQYLSFKRPQRISRKQWKAAEKQNFPQITQSSNLFSNLLQVHAHSRHKSKCTFLSLSKHLSKESVQNLQFTVSTAVKMNT